MLLGHPVEQQGGGKACWGWVGGSAWLAERRRGWKDRLVEIHWNYRSEPVSTAMVTLSQILISCQIPRKCLGGSLRKGKCILWNSAWHISAVFLSVSFLLFKYFN